jgi:hypothetical protein
MDSKPSIHKYIVATVKVPICVYNNKEFEYMNASCITTEIETYDVLPVFQRYSKDIPEIVNDLFLTREPELPSLIEPTEEPPPLIEEPPPPEKPKEFVLLKRKTFHPSNHQTFRHINHIKKQYTKKQH